MAFRLTGDWQLSINVGLKVSSVFLPSTEGNLSSLQDNDYNICYTMGNRSSSLAMIDERVLLSIRRLETN